MVCLDQQYSGREETVVAAAAVVVENFPISDLDDFSSPNCICCLKDHNSAAVGFGFAAEEVYYKCLQHRLQDAH